MREQLVGLLPPYGGGDGVVEANLLRVDGRRVGHLLSSPVESSGMYFHRTRKLTFVRVSDHTGTRRVLAEFVEKMP